MCQTVPARIKFINKNIARVKVGAEERDVRCVMLDVKVGDWVLINADLAVEKVTKDEAKEINKIINNKF